MWKQTADRMEWRESAYRAELRKSEIDAGLRLIVQDDTTERPLQLTLFARSADRRPAASSDMWRDALYVRDRDLVLRSRVGPSAALDTEVIWRLAGGAGLGDSVAWLTTTVAVSTPSRGADARLSWVHRLPARRWWLGRFANGVLAWTPGQPAGGRVGLLGDSDGCGWVALRAEAAAGWSIAIAAPAVDLAGWCCSACEDGGLTELQFEIFDERLERGVIRRTQVEAVLYPDRQQKTVDRHLADVRQLPPPLSS